MVVVGIIALWWVVTHGEGTAPGRLAAWLVMLTVVWAGRGPSLLALALRALHTIWG